MRRALIQPVPSFYLHLLRHLPKVSVKAVCWDGKEESCQVWVVAEAAASLTTSSRRLIIPISTLTQKSLNAPTHKYIEHVSAFSLGPSYQMG